MRLRPALLVPYALGLALSGSSATAGAEPASKPAPSPRAISFDSQVVPLLGKYCTTCHGRDKPKGGLDLARFRDESTADGNRKVWQRVIENIESGEMPPEGKPQPSERELAILTGWIGDRLAKLDCAKETDP